MSFTIWFTGLSGSGKTTLSKRLYKEIENRGLEVELLDGDAIRTQFSPELGFSKADREANVMRLGFFSKLLNKHGVITVVAAIAPYEASRRYNRETICNYLECFCDCDIDTLIKRDPRGLYKRALAGEIKGFTGIADVYERPQEPELRLNTNTESPDTSYWKLIAYLESRGLIPNGR